MEAGFELKHDSSSKFWYSGEVQVGLWKFIRRGWDGFVRFVRCDVEDGSKVQFWHDLWPV